MTLSVWLDNTPDKVQEEVDIVIIGGGIVGCGAAYWLSRRKGLKVMLLESGRIAGGASGRNAEVLSCVDCILTITKPSGATGAR